MKKSLKKVIGAGLALSMVFSMAACGQKSSDSSASASGSEDKTKIVVMPKVVGIDYYNAVKQGVDEAAKELGDKVEVTWQGPTEATVDKQIEMLETIIPTQPDVICIAANDPDAIKPTLEKAEKAGIKVVSWDADANTRDIFVNLVDYTTFGKIQYILAQRELKILDTLWRIRLVKKATSQSSQQHLQQLIRYYGLMRSKHVLKKNIQISTL